MRRFAVICFITCLTLYVLFPLFSIAQTITPITEDVLRSASFPIDDSPKGSDKITFGGTDGAYSHGTPGDPDYVYAEIQKKVFGDINGDHVVDAVVVIGFSAGGSGNSTTIYAVIGTKGDPLVTKPLTLGDRIPVNSISIRSGKIILDILKHGPNDPSCCPSVKKTLTYSVKNGALVGSKFKDW